MSERFSEVEHFSYDMPASHMVSRISEHPFIVECGCHDGRDSEKFLQWMPGCRLVCFEPDPRPLERHEPPGFIRRIGADRRVMLIRAAVSDSSGEAVLYRSSGKPPGERWEGITDWDHSSSIQRPTGHYKMSPWCTFPENHRLKVRTVTLDEVPRIQCEPIIDLVWADTQGAEGAVIAGARQTLKRTRWLYTEFYDTPMYEGQPNLETITGMLPGWQLVAIYGGYNALFYNTKEFC